jgi:hypothetical protein
MIASYLFDYIEYSEKSGLITVRSFKILAQNIKIYSKRSASHFCNIQHVQYELLCGNTDQVHSIG